MEDEEKDIKEYSDLEDERKGLLQMCDVGYPGFGIALRDVFNAIDREQEKILARGNIRIERTLNGGVHRIVKIKED